MKKIIGVGVVTGVVMFAFFRSLSAKVDRKLSAGKTQNPQLVQA